MHILLWRWFGWLSRSQIWFCAFRLFEMGNLYITSRNSLQKRLRFETAFMICNIVFECLLASIPMASDLILAFECIRLLLNTWKWLLQWLPKIPRALIFGKNLHRVMLPVPKSLILIVATFRTFAKRGHVHYNFY